MLYLNHYFQNILINPVLQDIPYIGRIPFDTRVSQSQSGNLFYKEFKGSVTGQAIAETVNNIQKFITK